jgi:DNA-binding transcriptional MerR regulator
MARLVSTSVAARELGIARSTLQRWATQGLITPDLVTPGGHHRWDVERLREELRGKPARREDD